MRTLIGLLFTIALIPNCVRAEDPKAANGFDFSFSGGTATELVEALKVASGTSIRSLIPQRMAANKVIPSVSLKDTSIKAVLLSLSKLNTTTVGVWVSVEGVWVLVEAEQEVKSIYIGHLLNAFDHETIAEAIISSWRCEWEALYWTGGSSGSPKGKFYWYLGAQTAPFNELSYDPKTKVLLAKATPAQIRVAVDLVKQLEIPAKSLPDEKPSRNPRAEGGAGQPPTAVDSKSENDKEPKPDSDGLSQ